jgi:hypothetical protein
MGGVDDRFGRLPFGRVNCFAEYWALRAVETDHVGRVAHQEGLSQQQYEALEAYWLKRVEAELSERLDEWHFEKIEASHRSRAPWRLRSKLLAQLWFNTLGPGARTWFGNRYTTVGRYTFRPRWRP